MPPGWVNYSISKTAPNGSWHKLERGEVPLDAEWFKAFNKDLRDPERWKDFWTLTRTKEGKEVGKMPPIPEVDGEWMFWDMMSNARAPDPWMWPAVRNLKASGRYIIAALSNTIIFPPEHPYSQPAENDVRRSFDVFVSSAHVGLRKPDPKIYELALQEVNKYAKEHAATKGKDLGWVGGIKSEDVIFLDDIGENLRAAKKAGFGTIKVNLGMAYEAVAALEELTGLKLAGDHVRISSAPKVPRPRL
jgi:FMN phosphatase YigB (HAD superfamily)